MLLEKLPQKTLQLQKLDILLLLQMKSRVLNLLLNQNKLQNHGYEKGDVFYRRIGAPTISYFHYFEEPELMHLLDSVGFKIEEKLSDFTKFDPLNFRGLTPQIS